MNTHVSHFLPFIVDIAVITVLIVTMCKQPEATVRAVAFALPEVMLVLSCYLNVRSLGFACSGVRQAMRNQGDRGFDQNCSP